jgi:hypothetical protein
MMDYSTRRSFKDEAARAGNFGSQETVMVNSRWRSVEREKELNHSKHTGYYSGIQLVNAGGAAEVFHSDVIQGCFLTGSNPELRQEVTVKLQESGIREFAKPGRHGKSGYKQD